MIGSFPIVAHNQQYTPGHSRFQICRHGRLREPFICLCVYGETNARAGARAHVSTHTSVRAHGCVCSCAGEGALRRRI